MGRSNANKSFKRQQGRKAQPASEQQFPEQIERMETRRVVAPLTPLTESQRRYISAMSNFTLTFATGPAGTGKTYCCASLAAQMLEKGQVDKIIITRPAVEAGESLGFLPGEIADKYAPYLAPMTQVFNERLGRGFADYCVKTKKIEAMPMAYLRGMTFKDAFVILDEAQNTTPTQMKMFLTRIGENCTVVVNGDMEQKDIHGISGIEDAVRKLSFIPSVKVVNFGDSDVVRSGLVSEIISAYRAAALV